MAAAILLVSLNSAFALDANALPSEHQVVSGQVQVTSNGTRMDIQQPSAFTASSFGITDADFESGNLRFTRNGSSICPDRRHRLQQKPCMSVK